MSRLPPWMKQSLETSPDYARVQHLVSAGGLHTVCQSARCPNRLECWNHATATFMILGDVCTRRCRFCAVHGGVPPAPDPGEPRRVAEAARELGLRHVVITSVTRDDLPDGGSHAFAETIRAVREGCPQATIEVLTPDFGGAEESIADVLRAAPDVFNHNLETVRRLQPSVRPQASYERSLAVLRAAGRLGGGRTAIKSGIMVGLGESDEELFEAMRDLVDAGCGMLTLGQYLAPSPGHLPVARYVSPAEFDAYARRAREMGFAGVASGPRVRSSYHAAELVRALRAG